MTFGLWGKFNKKGTCKLRENSRSKIQTLREDMAATGTYFPGLW